MALAPNQVARPVVNGHKGGVMAGVVRRFTYPAERPLLTVTLYYAALVAVAGLLLWAFPGLRPAVSGERLAQLAQEGTPFTAPTSGGGAWLSWQFTVLLAVSMVGAFLLMLPSSWVYMATRRRKGFDQSIVQTIIILALAVAGVVVIVRNSLALAFSLAGIVGAVRFRNTLPDTRDTLYVFLAIGVGLAAGVEALAAGAVLSAVFNYVILFMYHSDYGMCDLGRPAGHLLLTARTGPPAGRNGKESGKDGKERRKAEADFNAVLLVRARGADGARQVVEPFLARETKRWHLREVESNAQNGESVLKYLVRLGKKHEPGDVEDALLAIGGTHVIGARVH